MTQPIPANLNSTPQTQKVVSDWHRIEDAFLNNARDVHSYLNCLTGEVHRVTGDTEPELRKRIAENPVCLLLGSIRPSDQYVWMEQFIEHMGDEEEDLQDELHFQLDGGDGEDAEGGPFSRFKKTLSAYPEARERYFYFRHREARRFAMEWFARKRIQIVDSAETGPVLSSAADNQERALHKRLVDVGLGLPADKLEQAVDFVEALGHG